MNYLRTLLLLILFNFAPTPTGLAAEGIPEWARTFKPPSRMGMSCYIGGDSNAATREAGLESAWKGALVEIVRREFPHLIKINEQTRETLKSSEYSRDTILQGDQVRFKGVAEDKDSPSIEPLQGGGFSVHRLLCWSNSDLQAEKQRQIQEEKSKVPAPSSKSEEILPLGAQSSGVLGSLDVITIPAGATVLLQSRPVGVSNASFEKVVPGAYELVLQKDGYEIRREPVVVQAGLRAKVQVALNRAKTMLFVSSRPSGARILVDNKPIGLKTPSQITQDVGDRIELLVEMDDYRSERKSIDVGVSLPNVGFELAMYDGRLSVLTEIPTRGAKVFLGDKFIGDAPLWGLSVPGGQYKLRISAEGYNDFVSNIEIRASRPLAITTRLDAVLPVQETPTSDPAASAPSTHPTTEVVATPQPTPEPTKKPAPSKPKKKIAKKCQPKASGLGSLLGGALEEVGSIAEDEIGIKGAKGSAQKLKKNTDCLP